MKVSAMRHRRPAIGQAEDLVAAAGPDIFWFEAGDLRHRSRDLVGVGVAPVHGLEPGGDEGPNIVRPGFDRLGAEGKHVWDQARRGGAGEYDMAAFGHRL